MHTCIHIYMSTEIVFIISYTRPRPFISSMMRKTEHGIKNDEIYTYMHVYVEDQLATWTVLKLSVKTGQTISKRARWPAMAVNCCSFPTCRAMHISSLCMHVEFCTALDQYAHIHLRTVQTDREARLGQHSHETSQRDSHILPLRQF